MYFFKVITILLSIFSTYSIMSEETCSRTAVMNYQEILVDTNSTQKGEGLRYHIEKDSKAKSYLDLYQQNAKIKWPSAVLGTAGTSLLVTGFLTGSSSKRKNTFLVSGAVLMIVNFFIAKTLDVKNESNLNHAIEEYNQRNIPRIYLNPKQGHSKKPQTDVYFEKKWSF